MSARSLLRSRPRLTSPASLLPSRPTSPCDGRRPPVNQGKLREAAIDDQLFSPSQAAKTSTYTTVARSPDRNARALGQRSGWLLARRRGSGSTGSSSRPRSRTPASSTPTSRSNGSRTGCSTSPPTASTGTSRRAATRSRSSGKATLPAPTARSPIASCTSGSAASPMCSRPTASRRATASPSTCR